MGFADFARVDMIEPVIGDHPAGDIEDHAAQRIALVGVGVHPPVELLQVFIDRAPTRIFDFLDLA